MRYSTRRKNRRALLRDERLSANSPLVFAFEDLEGLVFAVMDVYTTLTGWGIWSTGSTPQKSPSWNA